MKNLETLVKEFTELGSKFVDFADEIKITDGWNYITKELKYKEAEVNIYNAENKNVWSVEFVETGRFKVVTVLYARRVELPMDLDIKRLNELLRKSERFLEYAVSHREEIELHYRGKKVDKASEIKEKINELEKELKTLES